MKKNYLRLVVSNKQVKKKYLDKFIEWFTKSRVFQFGISDLEKKELVRNYLTVKFAEYQLTTGDIDLFPLSAAINETERLERTGKLDAYYKLAKRKMAI